MKKTIFPLTLFFIILITLFLWKEFDDLNLSNKIDDAKVANFFTSFGGIVVIISLYYLYQQLREMKLVYYPDLYLSSCELKVNIEPCHPIFGEKDQVKIYNIIDGKVSEIDGFFQLNNIGLGASKNISIKWIYDIESVKNIFQNKYQYMQRLITEEQHLDFLEANGNIQIDVPEFYFNCCAPEYNFDAYNYKELVGKIIKGIPIKPKLQVEIKYLDIQNSPFSKKFDVDIMPINDKLKIKFKAIS